MTDQTPLGENELAPFESSVTKPAEMVEREIAAAVAPLIERLAGLERRLGELEQRVADHEKRRRREMRP